MRIMHNYIIILKFVVQFRKIRLEKQYQKLLEEQRFIHDLQKVRGLSLPSTLENATSELNIESSDSQYRTLPRITHK